MNVEAWILLAANLLLGSVIIPSVAWLANRLMKMQVDIAGLEVKMVAMSQNCQRHQEWQMQLAGQLTRMNNNVVRLCQAANVQHEGD